MSGRWCKSATRKGCRRKAACGNTCTATLTCKSIEIYIGKINRIKQLFDMHRNIHVNSYLINILIRVIMHYLSYHASIYPYKSPMSGRWGKSATRKGCRRKAACGHTCTATLTCKSIEIYIGIINRIKQLFDIYRNIHVNSYVINILIRVIVHYLSYHAIIYPYKSPHC